MQESNVRFYEKETGERVSHTPKAAHKDDDLPRFVFDAEDDRYRKTTSGDIFDDEKQVLVPSHAIPVRLLSKERYWEALAPDGNQTNFPSVTQVHNILANDGVVKWQVNNVIEFFLETMNSEFGINLNEPSVEDRWDADSIRAAANQASSPPDAAERGTRFHSAMELFLLGEDWGKPLLDEEIEPCRKIINHVAQEMDKRHGKQFIVDVERSFIHHELGIGGTADLRVGACVYDWKFSDKVVFGKRGGLLKSNWCYPDRALQLASYADGLNIDNPTLCNVFCNVHTGEVSFYDWPDPSRWLYANRLLNMFYYMFKLGRFPELGNNTGMIMHALEEWENK